MAIFTRKHTPIQKYCPRYKTSLNAYFLYAEIHGNVEQSHYTLADNFAHTIQFQHFEFYRSMYVCRAVAQKTMSQKASQLCINYLKMVDLFYKTMVPVDRPKCHLILREQLPLFHRDI